MNFDGHCLLFSLFLNYCCDGWPVMKCVQIHKDLCYNFKVGKIVCKLDENFPFCVLKRSDLLHLLNKLIYQKVCQGCTKNERESVGNAV